MLNWQAHQQKAVRNESFANDLINLPTRYTDWEVVAMFYSALHYVSAFLDTLGEQPKTHQQRQKLVAQHTSIAAEYEDLFQARLDARYGFVEFSPELVADLRFNSFDRVVNEMTTRIIAETL